jgi:anti-anti-sigma factor
VKLNIDEQGDLKVIRINGRIDASNCEDYRAKLYAEVEEKKKIVLCLEELDFIDSSGLGVLVKMLQMSLDRGGDVLITNLNYKTRLVFEITRANNLFSVFNSVNHAVESVA